MKQALIDMLALQDQMNSRVHVNWREQGYEWYRAIWIECAELMDHHGYKWWKAQAADVHQVQLEVIDIWHFGLSAKLVEGSAIESLAAAIESELSESVASGESVLAATEALALHALQHRQFAVPQFAQLMQAAGLDFGALYTQYIGKNVLNFFRQDHGYKEGSYKKVWAGREDNEHLSEVLTQLDSQAKDYQQQVYEALSMRYKDLNS